MPKVRFFEKRDQLVGDDGKVDMADVRWAALGWAKWDENVQVGVGIGDIEHDENTSHWMILETRADVNRFIRELRQARDQSFGKDE